MANQKKRVYWVGYCLFCLAIFLMILNEHIVEILS